MQQANFNNDTDARNAAQRTNAGVNKFHTQKAMVSSKAMSLRVSPGMKTLVAIKSELHTMYAEAFHNLDEISFRQQSKDKSSATVVTQLRNCVQDLNKPTLAVATLYLILNNNKKNGNMNLISIELLGKVNNM